MSRSASPSDKSTLVADREAIARLRCDLQRVGDAFERKAAKVERLEGENFALRMRLIRLRRLSGIRGV